ncbi:MAG: spermidine synthase [Myxococcota bacterium]
MLSDRPIEPAARTGEPAITRANAINGLTLLVATCSIIYELIFSQALTVLFGQTVTRYSLTIGLYLFSLGVGAFLYARSKARRVERRFYVVEVTLALAGPLGVLFIFALNSLTGEFWTGPVGQRALLVASHLPVLVVGLLSGLELPLLASLAPERDSAFYRVLGWDYLGSLVGTVLYALWLYPRYGLVASALAIGFLNAVAAVTFFAVNFRHRAGLVANLTGLSVYLLVLGNSGGIADYASRTYVRAHVMNRFAAASSHINEVSVLERFNTRYQEAVKYEIEWSSGDAMQCLDLDSQLQMCTSWVEAYHHGLVDVPMAFFSEDKPLTVLLLGGGDYIPMHYLAQYKNLTRVDHVDIDPEFLAYARRDPLLRRYNHDAFTNPKLNTIIADAMNYVRNTDQRYDLILLDLPGLSHDKLLPLYSVEFFRALRLCLKEDGLLASWMYRESFRPRHVAIYLQTALAAGFADVLRYDSVGRDDVGFYPQDRYVLFSAGGQPSINIERGPYVKTWGDSYSRLRWQRTERNEAIQTNSVFRPNLGLLVGLHP